MNIQFQRNRIANHEKQKNLSLKGFPLPDHEKKHIFNEIYTILLIINGKKLQ